WGGGGGRAGGAGLGVGGGGGLGAGGGGRRRGDRRARRDVRRGGPADRAGSRRGDVVTADGAGHCVDSRRCDLVCSAGLLETDSRHSTSLAAAVSLRTAGCRRRRECGNRLRSDGEWLA